MVADQRLHKLSSKLIGQNQTVALEDLNVSGMARNHKPARALAMPGGDCSGCSWSPRPGSMAAR